MKNPSTHRRTPSRTYRASAACAAVALVSGSLLTFGLATAASAAPATVSALILGVGGTESQRDLSWYSDANTNQSVQLAPAALVSGTTYPASAVTFAATVAANTVNGGFNGKATITGLAQNTTYSYRVIDDQGGASPSYTFKTQSFTGGFDFLFFGDPQIGASGSETQDGAGWADTVSQATTANPNAELFLSGGDQIETANTESQWNQFLAPAQLKSYPWAPNIGNHDVGGKAYEQHFNPPNYDRSASYYAGSATTTSGGDYWFLYKGVLFVVINSNSYASGGDAAHIGFVTSVINAHRSEAQHIVLSYHHAIYSPADHANDADAKVRRIDFPQAFSNLGVDLVLQGHDHSYSRSYEIKGTSTGGVKADAAEQAGAAQVQQGPGGVIYVTGNSASGSKYYPLSAPTGTEYPADPTDTSTTHKRHYANSVENQEGVRNYIKVTVGDKLTVENLRAGTCAAPNAAIERGNFTCTGTSPSGSTVDKVTITPNAAPAASLPEISEAVLLPLAGLAVGGVFLVRRRRREGVTI